MRKILFLHNNNLPEGILQLSDEQVDGLSFDQIPLTRPSVSTDPSDTFLSVRLREEIKGKYDLIILPYSLNEDNVMIYDGIVCGCHIRLDESLQNARTPILFLGPDSPLEVMRQDPLGSFLSSPGVFCSRVNDREGVIRLALEKRALLADLDDQTYEKAVRHLVVPTPDNFGDDKHSVTNLWSLVRWHDMISWDDDDIPALSKEAEEFRDSLYFKWSEALLGLQHGERRQEWTKGQKKKNPVFPRIPDIKGKKVLHIDDQGTDGWYDMLAAVFRKSDAEYLPFKDFCQTDSKETLLTKINQFIDSEPEADCYIIDLRLHEDDNKEDDTDKLSGHDVAEYIDKSNHGNQIVLFTASDKVWNLKKSAQYITDYALKEDPSRFLSRDESSDLFGQFKASIRTACNQGYLKEYSRVSAGYPTLRDFTQLLRMNLGKRQQVFLKPAALSLIVFIESFIKEHYGFKKIDKPWIIYCKDDGKVLCDVRKILVRKENDRICEICEDSGSLHPGLEPLRESDLGLIIAVLHWQYSIPGDVLLKVIELKEIRNTSIAHGGNDVDITIEFLKQIFDSVVKYMISQLSS